ncbi:hypothetical protein BH11PSE3_BH11PSE3_30410 [soil metagenome]
MLKSLSLTALAATAALAVMPVMLTTPADAQVQIQLGPQQAQQPRNGAWGDRDHDGVPNAFDNNNNRNNRNNQNYNNRSPNGDQDHDGIPNKYDTDRDGDGRSNNYDRNPSNPHR